jgi:hypothetical protein
MDIALEILNSMRNNQRKRKRGAGGREFAVALKVTHTHDRAFGISFSSHPLFSLLILYGAGFAPL